MAPAVLPDPRTTPFNICLVDNNSYTAAFDGIVAQFRGALADLGYECTLNRNYAVAGAVNILMGTVVYIWNIRGAVIPTILDRRFVLYQVEQLTPRHAFFGRLEATHAQVFEQSAVIWEYSPSGMKFFQASPWSDKVHHVPPAFHRSLESFGPMANPTTDVLFFGTISPRRHHVLNELASRGVKLAVLEHVYGAERDAAIADAKIVLNVHSTDADILETPRISHVLANRGFVISETGDHNPYGDGVVYAKYGNLVDTCLAYLEKPEVRREIADKGYAAVRRCDLVAHLRDAVARLPIQELIAI